MKCFICIFSIFVVLFTSCDKTVSPTPYQKKTVLVSIAPYAYFVERIAGDSLQVEVLVPPTNNPHLFEPTPRQVEQASHADIWFKIGESFEKKIFTVLKEQNQKLQGIDLCQGISLLEATEEPHSEHSHHTHDEGKDRHIWLSPKRAKIQAQTIKNALAALYPEHEALFAERLGVFLKDLDGLDLTISTLLEPLKDQAILVSHPAFGYFCQDYALLQLSIEMEGKDPLPQSLTKLLAEAESCNVRSVLTQAQYNNKGAEVIARELHLPIFMVDPYNRDYLENLKSLAILIAHPHSNVDAKP